MKKTFLLFTFCSLLSLLVCCNSQAAQGTFSVQKDNLESWFNSPLRGFLFIYNDSDSVTGKKLLRAWVRGKGSMTRSFPLYHLQQDSIKVDVKISYKSKDCKKAFLTLTSLDQKEHVADADTMYLPLSDDVTTYSKTLAVKSLYALVASVDAEGEYDDKNGFLEIYDIDLSSCGEPLSKVAVGYHPAPVESQDIVGWDDMLHLLFMDKKYLGLGETSHGTETYEKLICEVMKERILNHQCKLVLFELPLNRMLYVNRYVKNDERFNIERISEYLKNTFTAESTIDFIQWVKAYNASHKNEISVLGFDFEEHSSEIAGQISRYIRSLNISNVKAVNDLCDSIVVTDNISSLLTMFDRTNLDGVVGSEEVGLIRSCISDLQIYDRLWTRDGRMSKAVEQIFSKYLTSDATVTFWGHFNHMNYISIGCVPDFYLCPSLGSALRGKYGEDYSCIAFSALKGETIGKPFLDWVHYKMEDAPEESIEYQVGKWGKFPAFLSVDKLQETSIYKMRFTYQREIKNQFKYLIPGNRVDGIIVVDKTEYSRLQFKDNAVNVVKP